MHICGRKKVWSQSPTEHGKRGAPDLPKVPQAAIQSKALARAACSAGFVRDNKLTCRTWDYVTVVRESPCFEDVCSFQYCTFKKAERWVSQFMRWAFLGVLCSDSKIDNAYLWQLPVFLLSLTWMLAIQSSWCFHSRSCGTWAWQTSQQSNEFARVCNKQVCSAPAVEGLRHLGCSRTAMMITVSNKVVFQAEGWNEECIYFICSCICTSHVWVCSTPLAWP